MKVTPLNLTSVLETLQRETLLAVDTETTGLEETDVPFACIIATQYEVYYFDDRLVDFWSAIAPLFENKDLMVVFQNAKFDMRMLGMKGITCHCRVTDIAVASRLLRNDHLKHNLDAQAMRVLDRRKDKRVEEFIKEHKLVEKRTSRLGDTYESPCYHKVPIELMEEYACLDARLTYDLYLEYMDRLDDGAKRVWANENDLIKVCFAMERRGLLLNKDYTQAARAHELQKHAEYLAEYKEKTGVAFVNSAKAIQKALGVELPKTGKGNPSLTDDIIEDLLPKYPVLELVRNIRTHDKRISTYYNNYLNMYDKDGVVHPTMWQAGTRTGRFSYSDPNLQNIPKEEDSTDKYVVRGCFKPRPGTIYVSFDYKQMEYRMAAAYANEKKAIDAVMSGADFHQATADLVGITRKHAKTLNFAILYGAGNDKVARMLGMTTDEAQRLRYKYFMALPMIERFIDDVVRTGKARGSVLNWMGRRLYADKEFAYALPNHLIQGGGADIVKVAMVRIAEKFPELPMVLQVHDQLVFELTPGQLKYIPEIQALMESIWSLNGMTLGVDVSWSSESLAERDMHPWSASTAISFTIPRAQVTPTHTKSGSLEGSANVQPS